jgi:hypothetical protein
MIRVARDGIGLANTIKLKGFRNSFRGRLRVQRTLEDGRVAPVEVLSTDLVARIPIGLGAGAELTPEMLFQTLQCSISP